MVHIQHYCLPDIHNTTHIQTQGNHKFLSNLRKDKGHLSSSSNPQSLQVHGRWWINTEYMEICTAKNEKSSSVNELLANPMPASTFTSAMKPPSTDG